VVTFILGASDREMQFIKEAIQLAGYTYAQATLDNKPVKSNQAYIANGIHGRIDGYSVFVECNVRTANPISIIDHHREGDPGYGKTPDQYWQASSIGQTIRYLVNSCGVDLDKTFEHRLSDYRFAAAADHCLTAAYQGKCPGIDPDDLAIWRASNKAVHQGVDLRQLLRTIDNAKSEIKKADKIHIDGVDVAIFNKTVPELPEASAQMGHAFQAELKIGSLSRRNIMSAPPNVIEAWMIQAKNDGLTDIYGDPQRGYAGAYYKEGA